MNAEKKYHALGKKTLLAILY